MSPARPAFVALQPLVPRAARPSSTSALRMASTPDSATTASTAVPSRPARVVLSPLPRVMVYDHCPFATRVRYALGVKNVKHTPVWLMNDDVDTPTARVGKKIVPIFEPEGAAGPAVPESMDICVAVDGDARYGPPAFQPATPREDIAAWFADVAPAMRRLTRPRNVLAPLPEFVFEDAREAFVRNHPLPEPSDYQENMDMSEKLLAEVQPKLQALDDLIFSEHFCTEGGLSFDDVDLFPRLRTMTIVKGLVFPEKMTAYIDFHSKLSEVPVYYCYAQ